MRSRSKGSLPGAAGAYRVNLTLDASIAKKAHSLRAASAHRMNLTLDASIEKKAHSLVARLEPKLLPDSHRLGSFANDNS